MVIHSGRDGRPLPSDLRGRVQFGEAIVFPVRWGENTYARAAAVFQGVLGDVNDRVARTPQDRLLVAMRTELQRYQ
eukprot:8596567-Alexandrium_andersonii.AAC.1